uniref:Ribosomal RNA small subunit methyltransferase NEP1 isoform X2 n=1 Tax=Elaeis guineensis var. tenera TaxID=51953 RepID=A0A6I9S315_ELAGV|nr:ribosomal RNA small subunit methyltransferase NEP1 isoform X2 [Elaeis guineensis]
MVRPYAVKGRKHKKRKIEKVVEEQKDEVLEAEEEEGVKEEEAGSGGEAAEAEDERRAEEAVEQMAGIPIMPPVEGAKKPGVIFVLEKATLEIGKVGKAFHILNSDEHAHYLKKQNRNPADYRPDIIHQALLAIFDSPVTKAGRLQAVYVKTDKGVLFEIKPYVRIPRTFKRFSGLMCLSYSSEKLVDLNNYVAAAASDDVSLVFVVGAMAHGVIDKEYADDFIAISEYPLSAACCLNRICGALEQKWRIR